MVEEKRRFSLTSLFRQTTPKPADRTVFNPGIQERDNSYLLTSPIIYHIVSQSTIVRTCITQLKQEIFRRGYHWDSKFALKCRSCGPKHSSSWVPDAIKIWGKKKYMAENKKGLNIVDDIEGQSKLTFLEDQIKHVERIYFAGGEPMMMDDHWYILELLKKHKRFDVRIMYNTNMARLDWKGKNVIDYWKLWDPGKIEIWPSLDEYGERAELVRSGTIWPKTLKNIETIIHLAAQPGVRISIKKPHNTLKQNLIPFINILELARIKKVKKFIYASSSSVYGDTKIFPFNEKDIKNVPVSVYGATKLSNEVLARSYSENFKLQSVGLRFFTVYGPYGRPDMAYYSFLENLKENKKIKVFNKGKMKRDFTYIDDVVDGILKVTKTKFKNIHEILNIGKGKPDDLMNLVRLLEKNYGKKFKIDFINNIPLGDIKKTFANVEKAKKNINWKPKTTLKSGIKKFVAWYTLNND